MGCSSRTPATEKKHQKTLPVLPPFVVLVWGAAPLPAAPLFQSLQKKSCEFEGQVAITQPHTLSLPHGNLYC